MAVFRKVKKTDYTVIDNNIFKNQKLTLKAKGMICTMLSLPDDWNFSEEGLSSLSNDSRTGIRNTLEELMKFGYLTRTRKRDDKGKLGDAVYTIYEEPMFEKPTLENPMFEKPMLVKRHNKILNNKVLNNKVNNNKRNIYKESYGTYKRVKLTIDEYLRLVNEFGEDFIKQQIEYLDEYVESNNNKNKYTNFNLVLRKSIRENWFSKTKQDNDFLITMKKERDKYDR